MIITLAGHVDHGKTSLVKALSGIDTDRLEEEKRRGLTIDLGFAYIQKEGVEIGFVDVPGHHKFIHNMVAGVAATQFAMLVIAADDGPMPQSREHLNILELMGLQNGVIVISKADKVSPERIDGCKQEVHELIKGTFLENRHIAIVSTYNGEGITELSVLLHDAAKLPQQNEAHHCFRLAIDRSFTIKGSGLVVTGTVHSGQIDLETPIIASSNSTAIRLRSLFKQNQSTDTAKVGDRCSLNLSGIDKSQISRGDWILEPSAYSACHSLVIKLQVLKDFPRAVKHWLPVHVFHATSHTTGKIALLDSAPLQPGQSALVEIVLDEPMYAKRKDRILLREFCAELTLGGGEVIDNSESPYRRRDRRRLKNLQHLSKNHARDSLQAMLDPAQSAGGVFSLIDLALFRNNWNITHTQVTELAQQLNAQILENNEQHFAYPMALAQSTAVSIIELLTKHHQDKAESNGVKQGSLYNLINTPPLLIDLVISKLQNSEKIKIHSGLIHLPSHNNALPARIQSLFDAYVKFAKNREQPPSLGDAAKHLRVPMPELGRALQTAARTGVIKEINNKRFLLPDQLKRLIQDVLELTVNDSAFTVKEYRDKTGIGRNTAIEVLEHFDAKGFTRRVENVRKRIATYK